jgi:protein FRG1
MVKPLSFKGDKKPKKRKYPSVDDDIHERKSQKALVIADAVSTSNDDDSWVTAEAATDITGPIIFALPSNPPSCIACDATGKVFTSELDNIVEGDLATAEPHDVRQVWVANRVAGTDNISFKGHHGR